MEVCEIPIRIIVAHSMLLRLLFEVYPTTLLDVETVLRFTSLSLDSRQVFRECGLGRGPSRESR